MNELNVNRWRENELLFTEMSSPLSEARGKGKRCKQPVERIEKLDSGGKKGKNDDN